MWLQVYGETAGLPTHLFLNPMGPGDEVEVRQSQTVTDSRWRWGHSRTIESACMQSGCEGPGDEVEVKTSLLLSVTARYRLIPSVTVCYWDVAQVKTKGTAGREYLVKLTNVGPPDSAGRRQVTFHVNGERWYVYI